MTRSKEIQPVTVSLGEPEDRGSKGEELSREWFVDLPEALWVEPRTMGVRILEPTNG